jgi:hypothetical protein
MHETIAENTDKILHADALGFDESGSASISRPDRPPLSSPMMFMAS